MTAWPAPVRVAVFQPDGELADVADALRRLSAACARAAADGADVLVVPEMYFGGYGSGNDVIRAVAADGSWVARASEAARANGVALVACGPVMASSGCVYNAAVMFERDGSEVARYFKTHLFSCYEKDIFTPGDSLAAFRWRGITCGLLICMDLEYTEPSRVLAVQGAQIIFCPTALSARHVNYLVPRAIVPARAMENHVFCVWSNWAGHSADRAIEYCGESAVASPDGTDAARAANAGECVISALCDMRAFADEIERNPYLTERRPALYGALTRV